MRHLFLALLLVACGHKTPADGVPAPTPGLDARVAAYSHLLPTVSDPLGFVDVEHCDSLTFSALLAASGAPVAVESAESAPGRWSRRPTSYAPCWSDGVDRGAPSTISRDGLLSVMWWAWSFHRRDIVDEMWNYGVEHAWKMGNGRLLGADTLFSPDYIMLLSRERRALGGPASVWDVSEPSWGAGATGFERQLQALQILLWGEVVGNLPLVGVERLREHAMEQPHNPLFAAARVRWDGELTSAVDDAVEPWPVDRLPTTDDWCSEWRTMNDDGERGAEPCAEAPHAHSGGELLLVKRILRGP